MKRTVKKSHEYVESIINIIHEPLIALDQNLRVVSASRSFYEVFKVKPEETVGQLIYDLSNKQWDIPKLRELLEEILPKNTTFDNFEIEHIFNTIGRRIMLLNARQTEQGKGKERIILLAIEDITERKRIEAVLRESEEKFRAMADLSPASIAIQRNDEQVEQFLYVNAAWETMTGYSRDEAMLLKPNNMIHPDMRAVVAERAAARIRGEDVTSRYENKIITKSGEVKWWDFAAKTILYQSAPAILTMAFDITERKQAENELQWKTVFLEAQVNSSIDGILVVNSQGKKILQNQRCIDLWKIPQNIVEQNDDAVQVQYVMNRTKYPEQFVEKVTHLYAHPHEISHDEIEFKDGMFLDRYSAPVLGQDGTNYGRIWTFRDITERKRAEELLRDSESKFRNLFENSLMGISAATPEGRLVQVNLAYAQMYGYDDPKKMMDEVNDVGQQLYANPKDRKEVLQILAEKGVMEPKEVEVVRRDGTHFFVLVSARVIRDADGKILYYQANHIDITERKRAESVLQESEERYKALFERSLDLVYVCDFKGNFIDANDAALNLLGYKKEEIGSLNFASLLSEDQLPLAFKVTQEIKETGIQKNLAEFKLRCRNGKELILESKGSAIISNGIIVAIQSIARNITERKQAEEALRETRDYLDNLLSFANAPIMVWDNKNKITKFNMAFERLTGYTMYDVIGKHPEMLFSSDKREKISTLISRTSNGENLISVEVPVRCKDGSTRIVLWNTANIYTVDAKTITATIAHGQDITKRKQVEEELQESELRFRSLYENATIGIYRTTPDGKILLANPVLVKMLGYPSFEKLAERNLEKDGFESPSQRKEFLEKIERDGVVHGHDSKWIRQDGKAIFVLDNARAIRDSQGKTLYYDGTVEDITERKQMEEGLRQMQKLEGLGTLAGGIAHDFNNILGIILAYNTSIQQFKNNAKKLNLATETIAKAVDRGKTLVQQILTFARKTETSFGAVNVNDVVMEIMTMIFETFPKVLTYAQNFEKGISFINADRSQLHQALLNLCVNARDAMPNGGLLSINTRMVSSVSLRTQHPNADTSSYVCIEVIDTGEGMNEETRKRIFEPFFTTKGIGKGTGLGLSVVFGVVQTHKGFIDVESELGKGTTFRLYLPVSQVTEPIVDEEEETLAEISGGTETLLVVEDEEMLMMSLRMVLEEKGYNVFSAKDGLEALKVYQEKKKEISLVMTDLGLPTITGLEVSQRIRKINPDEHIIIATGFLDPEMKTQFQEAGIEHFLLKPYDLRKVLKEIRTVLDGK
jgi:two-component system, cell cycle sensor histidine kinase and response regulator CckA